MKNKMFERNRRLQKETGRNKQSTGNGALVVRHCYKDKGAMDKTWWDDVGFYLNGVYISVWSIHPRMGYRDAAEALAQEAIDLSQSILEEEGKLGLFENESTIYKYIGKSGKRKKKVGVCGSLRSSQANKERIKDLEKKTHSLLRQGSLSVSPSFSVSSLSWCRGVSICSPMEIRGIDDLKNLCGLVKNILMGKTTLSKEFPDYAYTRESWVLENPVVAELSNL